MAKPYSDDFRQKVMQAIELNGLKKSEASQLFNISRNTINLWCQRKAETGDIKPKPRQASQQRRKITDWEKFRVGLSPRAKMDNPCIFDCDSHGVAPRKNFGSRLTTSTRLYGVTTGKKGQALLQRVPVSTDKSTKQRLDPFSCPKCSGTQ
ncbi:hypothetical protein DP117_32920 [Brasilonema sp. UFV-L1]|nr:hypothetical protein [Brasilonema sp. UFV-L1]